MTKSGTDIAVKLWTVPECPFQIETSVRVLDDIRLNIVDAFFSLPRGGAEIGGILLGGYDAGRLTICDYAALECEHAFGPSFTLSPSDETRLKTLLAKHAGSGPGRRPVGWYHSHTRSEIFLSDADLEIHKRYFPEPWQVALVIRPHTFEPARIGFFFRESDGSMRTKASYREDVLEALPMQPVPRTVPSAAAAAETPLRRFRPEQVSAEHEGAVRPGPISAERGSAERGATERGAVDREGAVRPGPVSTERGAVEHEGAVRPGPGSTERERTLPTIPAAVSPKPTPERDPKPAIQAAVEVPVPQFLLAAPPASRRWVWVVLLIGLGLGVGGAGFQTREAWLPKLLATVSPATPNLSPPAALGLNTIDRDGQLQINWDRASRALLNSSGAMLQINDGGPVSQLIQLDRAHLQTGSFFYARQAEKVDVTLNVHQADGPDIREVTSFFGKLPLRKPLEDPEVQKQRDALAKQAAKLTTDLNFQAAKTKKLEKDLQSMREEMKQQQMKRLTNQLPDK